MSPYEPGNQPHMLQLGDSTDVWLSVNPPMRFNVRQMYEIVRRDGSGASWSVRVASYIYSFALRDTGEIVAYHWHPAGDRSITAPHLHVGPAMAGPSRQLGTRYAHRIHFPTGLIPLSLVARMAIEEFGVHPLRDDWQQVLTQEQSS